MTNTPHETDRVTDTPHETDSAGNPCAPSPDKPSGRARAIIAGLMKARWYAVPDDTVGGYAVANIDRPVSAHRPSEGHVCAGTFLEEVTATHVASLHNAWLVEGNSVAYLAEISAARRQARPQTICRQPHNTDPCRLCGATWQPGDPVHPRPGLEDDPGRRCSNAQCSTIYWPGDLPNCPSCQEANPDSPHTWQTYPAPGGTIDVHVQPAASGPDSRTPAAQPVDLGDDPDGDIEGADYPPFPAGYPWPKTFRGPIHYPISDQSGATT